MKVYEEKNGRKYRFFVGEETTDKDGKKRIILRSGYFMTRKEAENRRTMLHRTD